MFFYFFFNYRDQQESNVKREVNTSTVETKLSEYILIQVRHAWCRGMRQTNTSAELRALYRMYSSVFLQIFFRMVFCLCDLPACLLACWLAD